VNAKEPPLLRDLLKFPDGIPFQDILGDLFSRLCLDTLQASFLNCVQPMASLTHGEVVAIDG